VVERVIVLVTTLLLTFVIMRLIFVTLLLILVTTLLLIFVIRLLTFVIMLLILLTLISTSSKGRRSASWASAIPPWCGA
jgi:hypothetical protein